MIIVVRDPSICPKCKQMIMIGDRAERIYLDFNKDIYKDYHAKCLREPVKEETKDPNQGELL